MPRTSPRTASRPRGRPKAELILSAEERAVLERLTNRRKTSHALALRARIILAAASGATNQEVAAKLGVNQATVGK
ncbi:MAG TPA: helix-turn-helix domain-containing protein, partial [Acidimicrobiales bacterium]|nr:helix-turn-helix domain-containing protein [Acidimicrobiales bacterium]